MSEFWLSSAYNFFLSFFFLVLIAVDTNCFPSSLLSVYPSSLSESLSSEARMRPASIIYCRLSSAIFFFSSCAFVKYFPSFFSLSIFSFLARLMASLASFSAASFDKRSSSFRLKASSASLLILSSSAFSAAAAACYYLIFSAIALGMFPPFFAFLALPPLAPAASSLVSIDASTMGSEVTSLVFYASASAFCLAFNFLICAYDRPANLFFPSSFFSSSILVILTLIFSIKRN